MNLICQRESELPPLCVQMGCTLPPFNPISFPSNLFSLLPFSLSMNTSFYIRFQQDDWNNKVLRGKNVFPLLLVFAFLQLGRLFLQDKSIYGCMGCTTYQESRITTRPITIPCGNYTLNNCAHLRLAKMRTFEIRFVKSKIPKSPPCYFTVLVRN